MSTSAGNLTYNIGLNSSQLMTGLKAAFGAILSYKALMMAANQVGKAFTLGGELNDLRAATGETAGNLLILRQAFVDAGLGSGTMETSLNMLRRSLSGINEMGERTENAFSALGLNMEDLKGRSAVEQFEMIGQALGGLATQEDKVAASMAIFGRSGGQMLRLFANPKAFDEIRASLGSMPEVMDRTAESMDQVGDAWSRVSLSITGAFVAALEPAIPLLDEMVAKLNSIDFTAIGAQIGATLKAVAELGFMAPVDMLLAACNVIGVALWESIKAALAPLISGDFWKGVALGAAGHLINLGAVLLESFKPAVAFLAAGVDQVMDEILNTLSWVQYFGGMKVTLSRPNKTFDEHYQDEIKGQESIINPAVEKAGAMMDEAKKLIGDSFKASFAGLPEAINNSVGAQFLHGIGDRIDEIMAGLRPPQAPAAGTPSPAGQDGRGGASKSAGSRSLEPAADRWARVGAFVGGTVGAQGLDYARQTARSTNLLERTATRIHALIERLEPATL